MLEMPASSSLDFFSSHGLQRGHRRFLCRLVWSVPTIDPYLRGLEASMSDHVTFIKVNIDQNSDLASHYGVASLPTLLSI